MNSKILITIFILINIIGFASATDFYVDPATGSSSGNGSSSSPWRTIEEVISAGLIGTTVRAGDTVFLRNGYHGQIDISGVNNSDYITIEAQAGHSPGINRVSFTNSSRFIIRGLEISPELASTYSPASNVDIEEGNDDIILENNNIYSVQDTSSWTASQWNALTPHHAIEIQSPNIVVRNNTLKNVGFGILITGNNALIEYNVIENIAADGMQVNADNVTIQFNTLKNFYEVSENHDDAIQSWSFGEVHENVVLRGNYVISRTADETNPLVGTAGTPMGIGGTSTGGVYRGWLIENNIVLVPHYHGIRLRDAIDSTIVNNIVFDTSGEYPTWITLGDNGQNSVIRNNMALSYGSSGTNITRSNNIVIGDYGADALFNDWRNRDMTHNPGSPAIDAGTSQDAPSVDILGTSRPQGSSFDIGAYEFLGGAPSVESIIIDHSAVEEFDSIPDYWIDEVKKMLLIVPGESHGAAYRQGPSILAAQPGYEKYAVRTTTSGAPEGPTSSNLRITDVYRNEANTGWEGSGGEEDFWTSQAAVNMMEQHLTYMRNSENNPVDAFGFGWCWDTTDGDAPGGGVDSVYGVRWAGRTYVLHETNQDRWGLDAGDIADAGNSITMQDYIDAVDAYNLHDPETKTFFTTSPVDNDGSASRNIGERGYQRYLKHEFIRDYVKSNQGKILFDYADILTHDSSGVQNIISWDGHQFPVIASENATPATVGHISEAGAIRIGKALWVLMARIAGWDGNPPTDCMGNDTSCGSSPPCQNCNLLDGCSGNSFRDYGCSGTSCSYSEDSCLDCSCSCGGYSAIESPGNANCSDGKDNDCDGQTDSADAGCNISSYLAYIDFEEGRNGSWTNYTPGGGTPSWTIVNDGSYGGSNALQLDSVTAAEGMNVLGAYRTINNVQADNFELGVKIRSTSSSSWRDIGIVFGYQNANEHYIAIFNGGCDQDTHGLFRVSGGVKQKIGTACSLCSGEGCGTLRDQQYHDIKIVRQGSVIEAFFDDMVRPAFTANDSTHGSGYFGIGSINDSTIFDDITITGIGEECVTMAALLGYIGDWKQGSIGMAELIQKIQSWKTGC